MGITAGTKAIKWIEDYCCVPEGAHVGRPVKLRMFQRREIKRIYDNRAGTRRAIISFGRKNGKTTFAACLLLLHLVGPRSIYNSQLFSAAQSRRQAAVLFDLAAKMVRMNRTLARFVVIRDHAKELFCPKRGTLYRALSAEASTAYGLSPAFVVHDELGQVEGPVSELYDALESATGAQDNALSVIISTQASRDTDLLSALIDDAQRKADPTTICSLYTAPRDADPFDVKTIKMANPAFGDFLNKKEVLAMAETARRIPASEASFRNLILNQRVSAAESFIGEEAWKQCGVEPVESFGRAAVWGGLDLSSVSDLTAFVLIGGPKNDGVWHVKPTFWLPGDGLPERSRDDRTPYDVWHRQKFLETTPGPAVNYDFVAVHIKKALETLNVQKIAFDEWNFEYFKAAMLRVGIPEKVIGEKFFNFRQGFKSMSPALRIVEENVLEKKIAHGNHPVLALCAANAVVIEDHAGNRKLTKVNSRGRIDGMVALAMAMGVAQAAPTRQPDYQMFVL